MKMVVHETKVHAIQCSKHVITHIIQSNAKMNPIVSIKTLIAEIITFMNYILSYQKTCLTKQKTLKMIHENRKELYAKLSKVLRVLQSCVIKKYTYTLFHSCRLVRIFNIFLLNYILIQIS